MIKFFLHTTTAVLLLSGIYTIAANPTLPAGLILDLDADHGLKLENQNRVSQWTSRATDAAEPKVFVKQDKGRKKKGSGRPTLKKSVAALNGKPSLSFRQQELVCMDEDAFDGLTTGLGNTWVSILCVYPQRVGLKDVNSFFGNLRNGARYEGLWGCVDDKNGLWYGARNGLTFGRFDVNNPKISGPKLEINSYYLIAGRMAAGTGSVVTELFVDNATPVAADMFPVDPKANPSKMAVGQERDAIQHPGKESFDGEIARLLIWQRPLSNTELTATIANLKKTYGIGSN